MLAGIRRCFLRKDKGEKGLALIEILWACAILAVTSWLTIPATYSLYRQAALEYETEHLLGEIRHLQVLSRTANHYRYNQEQDSYFSNKPYLIIHYDGYDVYRGDKADHKYKFLPGVEMAIANGNAGLRNTVSFDENGRVGTNVLTIVLFTKKTIKDGNAIIIDAAGRIRTERR